MGDGCCIATGTILHSKAALDLGGRSFCLSKGNVMSSSSSKSFPVNMTVRGATALTLIGSSSEFSSCGFTKTRFALFLGLRLSSELRVVHHNAFVMSGGPTASSRVGLALLSCVDGTRTSCGAGLIFPYSTKRILRSTYRRAKVMLNSTAFGGTSCRMRGGPRGAAFETIVNVVTTLTNNGTHVSRGSGLQVVAFSSNTSAVALRAIP